MPLPNGTTCKIRPRGPLLFRCVRWDRGHERRQHRTPHAAIQRKEGLRRSDAVGLRTAAGCRTIAVRSVPAGCRRFGPCRRRRCASAILWDASAILWESRVLSLWMSSGRTMPATISSRISKLTRISCLPSTTMLPLGRICVTTAATFVVRASDLPQGRADAASQRSHCSQRGQRRAVQGDRGPIGRRLGRQKTSSRSGCAASELEVSQVFPLPKVDRSLAAALRDGRR